jgi:hypothetical protein
MLYVKLFSTCQKKFGGVIFHLRKKKIMSIGVTLVAPPGSRADRSVVWSLRSQHAHSSIRFSLILNIYRPFALADHHWLPTEDTSALLSRITDSNFNSGIDNRPTSAVAGLGEQ